MASARSVATSDPILTNYAAGLAADRRSALAEFLAPTVVVPSTIGHYKKWDDQLMVTVSPTGRAVGGPAHRIQFEATDPTYNCLPQALEITIDDSEREAETNSPLALEQAKTAVLINDAVLSHENAVLTAVKAGVSAASARGNWSNTDIDPIDQIDEQIKAIADAAGILPNRIAMGIGAWRLLRQNTKVKNRIAGLTLGLGLEALASATLNPSIEVRVGVLVKSSTKLPATKSTSNIVGDECFIFYANPTPSTYDASFAKTFRGGSGSVDSVRVYRDEAARSDVLAIDWSECIAVVHSGMCKRLTIT